jgi:hypothetical protein
MFIKDNKYRNSNIRTAVASRMMAGLKIWRLEDEWKEAGKGHKLVRKTVMEGGGGVPVAPENAF